MATKEFVWSAGHPMADGQPLRLTIILDATTLEIQSVEVDNRSEYHAELAIAASYQRESWDAVARPRTQARLPIKTPGLRFRANPEAPDGFDTVGLLLTLSPEPPRSPARDGRDTRPAGVR